jgi:hypothetical protein
VLPLDGKKPRVRDFATVASTEDTTIRAWWSRWPEANPGTVCGPRSGVVVLDFDPRNYNAASLAWRAAHMDDLPATYTVQTGGGGEHRWFRHPGVPVRYVTQLAPGIELLGDGHVVVLPGAIHPTNRKAYVVIDAAESAQLPHGLLPTARRLHARREPASKARAATVAVAPTGVPQAIGGTPVPTVVPLGERHRWTTRVVGYLHRNGLDPHEIAVVVLDFRDTRCTEPESFLDAEVHQIVADITRKPRLPRRAFLRAHEPTLAAWTGRSALGDRRVARAVLVWIIFCQFVGLGVAESYPIPTRTIAVLACVSRATAATALQRLTEHHRGFLKRTAPASRAKSRAACYRLRSTPACAPTTTVPYPDSTERAGQKHALDLSGYGTSLQALDDLFRWRSKRGELGFGCGEIYGVLTATPCTVTELRARIPSLPRSSVYRALDRLREHGLGTRTDHGWVRGAADPAGVASRLGCAGATDRQKRGIERERQDWRRWTKPSAGTDHNVAPPARMRAERSSRCVQTPTSIRGHPARRNRSFTTCLCCKVEAIEKDARR